MSSELAMNLRRDAEQAEEIFLPWPEAYKLAAARIEALEAGNARLSGIVVDFLRAHDEGPGLIDCIDNQGERYTSQFLADTIRRARDGGNADG